ncbi:MAG TPA: histidine kinase [Chthoniobacterales bacterium]
MNALFQKVCVLVTAAFVLTLVPGFRGRARSLLSVRDQSTALLVFLVLGSVEEAAAWRTGILNERIVAVCAAGLVAGPWVGLAVGAFVTGLAVGCDGLPLGTIGFSMLSGGLAAGWVRWRRPELAAHPLTGFSVTLAVSCLRDGLTFWYGPNAQATLPSLGQVGMTLVLQGLGTALILAVVAQVRDRDEQARLTAEAEVRALQSRMNPHFLFNALNALAALATIAPREIPRAAGQLRRLLRASFDQADRPFVPLDEELAVVRAYLDLEALRLGPRLEVEEAIGPGLTGVLTPPFSLQPLVENAVQHGVQSLPKAGRLRLVVRRVDLALELHVSDDGHGVAPADVERVFFGPRPGTHALGLLRRRLNALFGPAFRLEVHSAVGQGTTVTLRIPLRMASGVTVAARKTSPVSRTQLASH